MIEPRADRPRPITLGGDKNYDEEDFVNELRSLNVTPHVAQNSSGRRSAIDGRTTRHGGYLASQRIRKRIEEAFGWIKTVAGQEKTSFRGLARVGFAFTFAATAYTSFACPSSLWRPADGQASSLSQGLRRPRADRRNGCLGQRLPRCGRASHITFHGGSDGEIVFGILSGALDVRYGSREGSAGAEFSWEGFDDNDAAYGRGWATIATAGRLVGHIYIHKGDDSAFGCERA